MMPRVLAGWSWWQFLLVILALGGAAVAVMGMIKRNGKNFPKEIEGERRNSSILEWKMSFTDAEAIVTDWRAHSGSMRVAYKGLALDTVLFIPLYSTFIAMLCFWAANVSSEGGTVRTVFAAFAWCAWIAGAFDLIENAGIFAEEFLGWYFVATPTACAALMKWGIALTLTLVAFGRLVVALLLRR